MFKPICMFLSLAAAISAGESFKAKLNPLDVQAGEGYFPLTSINQLESDGKYLYLRSLNGTSVVTLDEEGRFLGLLGRDGMGPGEWGQTGIVAISLFEDQLWGFGAGTRKMNGYENGQFIGDFRMDTLAPGHYGATSNAFGISESLLVVPSAFLTPHLAEVYDRNGNLLQTVGKPLETDPTALARNPVFNDTMWRYHEGSWYAVFKFFPVLYIFDGEFQLKNHFNPEDAEIGRGLDRIMSDEPEFQAPPLFTDFKIFRGQIYLMCNGTLLQIDKTSGSILSKTNFFGEGPEFGPVSGKRLALHSFTFLSSGTLVLAHPMMLWDHDLWTVKPPFSLGAPEM